MATREQVYRRFGPQLLEVIVMILKDEINLTREWTRDFKTEAAASTNLANLQSRVAALPTLTERTNEQLLDALETKWGETPRYNWMDEGP